MPMKCSVEIFAAMKDAPTAYHGSFLDATKKSAEDLVLLRAATMSAKLTTPTK